MVLQTIFYQDSRCIILAVLVTEKITFSNPYRHFTPICHKNQTYSTSFFLHISTAKCLLCFKLCDLRFLLKQKRRHFCHFSGSFQKSNFTCSKTSYTRFPCTRMPCFRQCQYGLRRICSYHCVRSCMPYSPHRYSYPDAA